MKKLIFCSLIIVAVLLGRLNATPLFSTLGPGDTYNTSVGWTIGCPGQLWDQGDQFSFTGANPYYLDTIELAVGLVSGTNALDVWLMSDAGGPATIIESFNFIGAMGPFGQNNPLLVSNSVLNPILSPNTMYWLIASAPDDSTWSAWNYSSPEVSGLHAQRMGSVGSVFPTTTMGAFRINGTPTVVPAPGAIALGSIGVAFVGWLRRRRTL